MALVHATVATYDPYLIANLPDNTSAFVRPWSFIADPDGKVYIATAYRWHDRRHGTFTVKVSRLNGLIVIDAIPAGICQHRTAGSTGSPVEPVYIEADS